MLLLILRLVTRFHGETVLQFAIHQFNISTKRFHFLRLNLLHVAHVVGDEINDGKVKLFRSNGLGKM